MNRDEKGKIGLSFKPQLLIPVVLFFGGIGCEIYYRQGLEKAMADYAMGTWMLICNALRHPLLFATIPFLLALLAAAHSDIGAIAEKGWYKWCLGISTAYLVLAPAFRLVAYLSPGIFAGSDLLFHVNLFIARTPYLFIIPGILWGLNKRCFIKAKIQQSVTKMPPTKVGGILL